MVLQAKRTTHASTRLGQRAAVNGTSDTCARNYVKFCTGKMYSQLKLFAFVLPHFKPGARKSNRFHTAPTRDLTIQHDAHEKRQGFLFGELCPRRVQTKSFTTVHSDATQLG